jgi:hypothetical protein
MVQSRLRSDPVYQRALVRLRRELGRTEISETALSAMGFAPPPGLARRTCDFVFAQARRAGRGVRRSMSPLSASGWGGSVRWIDVTVAAAALILGVLVTLPAIHSARFHARLAACQDNLRQLGLALTDYSERHGDYFPRVPATGKLAAAGIYAPVLAHDGFLTDPQRVLCPEALSEDARDFRIPTLEELRAASETAGAHLRQEMGGNYGYCLGHLEHGALVPTKNLGRPAFAVMADAPSDVLPGHQSINHGGRGQNVLFEDGHVEFATMTQSRGGDDIFANDDHLVSAGIHREDSVIAPSGTAPIIFTSYR